MGRHFLSSPLTTQRAEMRVFQTAAVVLVSLASVSPAPQFGGLKSLVKSPTGDDKPGEVNGDYEQVPYTVLAEFNGYEERSYPSVNYACTEMTYDSPDDEDSEEWGLERAIKWMTNKKSWKDRPQSKMFVSQDAGKITKDMCFFITKEFQSNPPEPVDPEVKIVKSKERIVFVKQFGGYAMQDSVWMKEADKFRAELSERSNEVDLSYFWTAGYDSPMKFWNRRNEVAFEKLNIDVVREEISNEAV